MKIKFHANLETSGTGLWSERKTVVEVTDIKLACIDDEEDYGELRVYFNTKSWNVNRDGLIYTDPKWLRSLRVVLSEQGYNIADIGYSEQGMQGNNYVSLDVGKKFLDSYRAKVMA